MSPCIKTGARVFFDNYGFKVPADIYEEANCYIIRWNGLSKDYCTSDDPEITHVVTLPVMGGWHRDDLGVTVIPRECLGTTARGVAES